MGAGNHSEGPSEYLDHDFEKSHFGGMVGRLRMALSPATRVRSANIKLVLACAHGHGKHVGHLISGPPPLSETAWPFACENTIFKRVR